MNGIPRNIDDIEKLESPLYKVRTKANMSFQFKRGQRKSVVNLDQDNTKRKETVNYKRQRETEQKRQRPIIRDDEMEGTMEIKTFNSNLETIFQVINSIIRYSVVQLPFCFKILGIINGSGIISLIGLMSIYSVILMVEIHLATGFT